MNEKNFDSISQFEVPKSWIDDALNVPQNNVKKPFPLIKFSRTIMAVASFILVCSLSVALYFITDDSSIPPVKIPASSQSINAETQKKDSGINESDNKDSENKESINQVDSASQSPSTQNSHPERSEDEIQDSTDALKKPDKNPDKKPADKPNKNPSKDNQENPVQTDAPENPKPTAPVERPTEEDVPPYNPDFPTEAPLYPSEAPPWVTPTENATIKPPYNPTQAPDIYPTNPPSIEEPTTNFEYVFIQCTADNYLLTGSKNIYCKILHQDGRLVGDPNLFSSSHLTVKAGSGTSQTTVWYYIYRNTDIEVSGTYRYVFYNENGDTLKYGNIYLQANV